MQSFFEYLKSDPKILKSIQQGIEKEGLRSDSFAKSSLKDHPKSLGSKLTHPYITTDYAENLMEFISPVFDNNEDMFSFLRELFSFAYKNIDRDEVIWPWSMPCQLPENEMDISVAKYGASNIGRLKSLYRVGLGHRYGKSMQSIAGVHYNFSLKQEFWEKFQEVEADKRDLQDFIDEKYFHLIRNYRRYSWILIYLFGSTPIVAESFLKKKKHSLKKLAKETYGLPYATSLRMGGLGYTSNAQKEISLCYNQLETYVKTLEEARLKPYAAYEKIGRKENEEYKQLNTNLLQIDNEFYSTIRPKRTANSKESALQALYKRGVEYIEVRLLDVDPFVDAGLSPETVHFLHLFLLGCLFNESSVISASECKEIDSNLLKVVNEGRDPKLNLDCQGSKKNIKDCAHLIMDKLSSVVPLLDQAYGSNDYSRVYDQQKQKINNSDLTPSAKILSKVSDDKSIMEVIYDFAVKYKKIHVNIDLNPELDNKWKQLTEQSLEEQKRIEENELLDFCTFMNDYFSKIKINFKDK